MSTLDVGHTFSCFSVNVSLFVLIYHPKLIEKVTVSIEHLEEGVGGCGGEGVREGGREEEEGGK